MADATYEEELKVTLESSDAVKALADLERAIGAYLKNAKELEKPVEVAIDTTAAVKELSKIDKIAAGATKGLASLSKPVKMVFTVADQATKVMQKIEGVAMKIVKKPYDLVMGVIDKATPAIHAIGEAAMATVNMVANATAVAATAVTALGVSSFEAAASVSEMNATLGALSKANNLAEEDVQATVKAVKGMGIETSVAQQSVAKMIQSELDLSKASKLARVAQDAAVIGQVNSSEALDRLIHGITTQQTDVLRGIGINVDATKAQEDYAKSVGKAPKALTAAEKSAAMLNAVLEEGTKIAGSYEAAMQEPGKVLRSFPRLFNDIKVAIGETMLDAFGPFILKSYDLVKAFSAAVQAGGPLNQLFVAIGDALSRIMAPLTAFVERTTAWIKGLDEEAVASFVDSLARIAPALVPIGAALAAIGGANIKGLLGPLGMLIPTINPFVAAIASLIVMIPGLRENVVDLGRAIFTAFTKDAGAIGVVYDLMTEIFGPTLANAMQPILQRIMEFMGYVRETGGWLEFLKGKFNDLRTALDPVIERLTRLAVNVLGTINRYMPQIALIVGNLAQAFRNLVGPSIDAVTAMNGWDDVERKMDKVMRKLVKMSERMKDLGKWVGENTDKVGKFIKVLGLWDVAGRILPGVGKGAGIALKVIGGIAGFIPKIAGGLGSVAGVIGKIMGAVKGG